MNAKNSKFLFLIASGIVFLFAFLFVIINGQWGMQSFLWSLESRFSQPTVYKNSNAVKFSISTKAEYPVNWDPVTFIVKAIDEKWKVVENYDWILEVEFDLEHEWSVFENWYHFLPSDKWVKEFTDWIVFLQSWNLIVKVFWSYMKDTMKFNMQRTIKNIHISTKASVDRIARFDVRVYPEDVYIWEPTDIHIIAVDKDWEIIDDYVGEIYAFVNSPMVKWKLNWFNTMQRTLFRAADKWILVFKEWVKFYNEWWGGVSVISTFNSKIRWQAVANVNSGKRAYANRYIVSTDKSKYKQWEFIKIKVKAVDKHENVIYDYFWNVFAYVDGVEDVQYFWDLKNQKYEFKTYHKWIKNFKDPLKINTPWKTRINIVNLDDGNIFWSTEVAILDDWKVEEESWTWDIKLVTPHNNYYQLTFNETPTLSWQNDPSFIHNTIYQKNTPIKSTYKWNTYTVGSPLKSWKHYYSVDWVLKWWKKSPKVEYSFFREVPPDTIPENKRDYLVVLLTRNAELWVFDKIEKYLNDKIFRYLYMMSFYKTWNRVTYAGPYIWGIENCEEWGDNIIKHALEKAYEHQYNITVYDQVIVLLHNDLNSDCSTEMKGKHSTIKVYGDDVKIWSTIIPWVDFLDPKEYYSSLLLPHVINWYKPWLYTDSRFVTQVMECFPDKTNTGVQVPYINRGLTLDDLIEKWLENSDCQVNWFSHLDILWSPSKNILNQNSIVKQKFGWLKDKEVKTLKESSSIILRPIDFPTKTKGTYMVRIPSEDLGGDYVLEYRNFAETWQWVYLYFDPEPESTKLTNQYLLHVNPYKIWDKPTPFPLENIVVDENIWLSVHVKTMVDDMVVLEVTLNKD